MADNQPVTEESAAPAEESSLPARMTPRQAWLLVGGLALLSVLLFVLDYEPPPELKRPPATAPGVALVGVVDGVQMASPPVVWRQTAVFVGRLGEEEQDALLAVDGGSGAVRWRLADVARSRPDAWPNDWGWAWPFSWQWGPVAALGDTVFFSDAYMVTTAVTALNAADGKLIWERHIGLINGGDLDLLLANEQQLVAQMAAESFSTFYALAPENGRSIRHQDDDAVHLFWYDETPQRFYERYADGIVVRGEQPWQQPIEQCGLSPLVTDAVILVQAQRCDETAVARLLAFSRSDGALLWQIDAPLVGNVAVAGETAVALTADAQLLLLDVRTGGLRAALPFAAPTGPPDDETNYFVGVSGETAVVYFGDSHQLFTYQVLDG